MKLEGQVRIPSGCAIAAVISKEGKRMSGEMITNAMKPMHDRSNGLGGGFAAYGIYPEYKEFYALHMFFDSRTTRKDCEVFLKEYFEIVQSEIIPTRKIPEKATHGPRTAGIQQIHRAGGAVHIRSLCLTGPLFITERFLPMMRIVGL